MSNKKIIIFVAPSGSGKTTIIQHVLKQDKRLGFTISATTRSPRPNEKEGKDYYFISQKDFKKKIKENTLAEYAEVYDGVFYATLMSEIKRLWSLGKVVIMDIDIEGALNMQKMYSKKQLITIFIKTPSETILKKRLLQRGIHSSDDIKKRLQKVKIEIAHTSKFDYSIVNDIFENTVHDIQKIINNFINNS